MTSDPDPAEYASIRLTHHVASRERETALKRRPGRRSARPECIAIGHAWIEEPGRDSGSICLVCQAIRFD